MLVNSKPHDFCDFGKGDNVVYVATSILGRGFSSIYVPVLCSAKYSLVANNISDKGHIYDKNCIRFCDLEMLQLSLCSL